MRQRIFILIATIITILTVTPKAQAGVYNFSPTPADIFDLDHYKYYTWRISWTPQANEQITSVKLFINNINNWQVEPNDKLYIELLDNAQSGLRVYNDNQGGGNNFVSWSTTHTLLDVYTDTADYPGPAEDYIYLFDSSEITKLRAYALNNGKFALGFDPDCHYWNDGAKLTIYTQHTPEPATIALMASGLLGGIGLQRKQISKS